MLLGGVLASLVAVAIMLMTPQIRSRLLTLKGRGITSSRALDYSSSSSKIPIIDIGVLRDPSSTLESRRAVAKKIGEACEEIGFIVIHNHGVDSEAMDAAWEVTRDFFDLPLADKMGFNSELLMTDEFPYGYSPYGSEKLSKGQVDVDGEAIDPNVGSNDPEVAAAKDAAEASKVEEEEGAATKGDMKEMFSIGPYLPEAMMPLPRYPTAALPSMAASWRRYFEEMELLSGDLMRGFALALDLNETWFEAKVSRHASSLRALNYPSTVAVAGNESSGTAAAAAAAAAAVAPAAAGQMRASPHTDYGVLSILRSGGSGLQVKLRDGEWHDVPMLPGAYVINLGDLMSRWTNDKWRSTPHRVLAASSSSRGDTGASGGAAVGGNRRQSMAYFCNLNMDADVEVIPTCVSELNPAKYPPTKAGDHLMAKHSASTRGILDDSWMLEIAK